MGWAWGGANTGPAVHRQRSLAAAARQVLKSDSGRDCVLYRKWGRIGTPIRGNLTQQLGESGSVAKFEELFQEKTGNPWALRGDSFEPVGAPCRAGGGGRTARDSRDRRARVSERDCGGADAGEILCDGPGLRCRRSGRARQRRARGRRGRAAAIVPARARGSAHVAHLRRGDDAAGPTGTKGLICTISV